MILELQICLMSRKQVPDLDSLESPLISANPLGSILGVIPGSALAERIFNDPDSWLGPDDDDGDLEDTDVVKWLADEAEGLKLLPIDQDVDIMLKHLSSEKSNFAGPAATEKLANWDDIAQDSQLPFLPLFDHNSLDLSLNIDLRFSKIWDAKGRELQSLKCPVSHTKEPKNFSSVADTRLTVPPTLNLGVENNIVSPTMSPLNVASASSTWSILELYGAHPNTPRVNSRVSLLTNYPPTPYHAKSSALSSLREYISQSSNATVTTAPPPSVPESTPIRRLPVIPDLSARTSPTPSRAPTPSRGSTLTPQRTGPPEQPHQYIKTHQRSASATTPNVSAPSSRRTPRGSATLPPPSSSPDPFIASPSSTPIRTGNLFTRSSPVGPRPRSNTHSIRQRQASGHGSPSPIAFEPVSVYNKSSSPHGLRLGVS
ncbi:hypothetical protein C0993_008555 [Termitomyces sp. T159_Od127]|nr:hypothetical protein C0993_008555 [Termitomyces sp. T159_Od127]